MAYIVNSVDTQLTTAGTSFAMSMGAHQADDLLLSFVCQDGGSGTFTVPTGWTAIGTQAVGGGVRALWAYKIAASSSETEPTWTSTLSDEWSGCVLVIRDVDTTSPIDGTPAKVDNGTYVATHVSGTLTTTADGALVLVGWGMDSGTTNRRIKGKLDSCSSAGKLTSTGCSHAIGYRLQESAGLTTAITGYLNSTAVGQSWTISVKNSTGGARQPDLRAGVTELRWYGDFGATASESTTWQAPSTIGASLNGITLSATINHTASTLISLDPWGFYSALACLESTESWSGGTHTIDSTDFTGKIFSVSWARSAEATSNYQGTGGILAFFGDGTNWAAYQLASKARGWAANTPETAFIDLATATPYATSGTLDITAVTRLGYFYHRAAVGTTAHVLYIKNACLWDTTAIVGGGANRPVAFTDLTALNSWNGLNHVELQGSVQLLAKSSVQVGDGSTTTYFDSSASSLEYPPAWSGSYVPNWQMDWNVGVGAAVVGVKAKTGDTINLSAGVLASSVRQDFELNSATSTGATYSFVGESIVGFSPVWKTGIDATGITFSRCAEIAFGGADVTNCTIKSTVSTDAACSFDTSGATVTGTTIDVSGTSAAYHLELGSSVTSITLDDVTFSGTPGTDKVHVLATTGTVTITIDGITSLAAGDVTSAGATVSIVAPTLERGQNFTGLVAGSKVKVFTTGTTTVLFGTDSSSTSFSWDDATAGSITVDYTIQKAGYLPIRVTGIVLTGAVGTGVVDTAIQQVADRAWVASSGLTYGTNALVTAGSKTFQLTTASTGQNWYSFWIEQWIDKGDTGEALANVEFPIVANGPNSFTLKDGWEFSDGATSIAYLSRDGLRYLNTSGVVTASWAALLSVGVPSGARVRYQQTDGGTTQSAAVTSGNIDELIQIYGDATHGNFDYTGYLVLKVQEGGYDQAEVDAVSLYGTLEDQLYVVGLAPTANGIAADNPTVNITITDHGASPVTWNSKSFSITITDNATTSGEDILQAIRYAQETGGTFHGTDAFNWHDLMQTNGDKFKGVRGKLYGDTGSSLKGVRVLRGTDAHPDVTIHTADDGTTVSTTPPAQATATILANSRIQLYNVTTATELDNSFQTGTSYANTLSAGVSAGDTLRLRVCKLGYEAAEAFAVWTTSGAAFIISQSVDGVYTAWGIDGSTVTEFAPDTTGHIYIESNDADGVSSKTRLGAYFSHLLTTEGGIRYYYGGITFLSTAAIRVNTAVVNILLENVNATTALRFSDVDVRLYRDDGSSIIAPTSYSLHNDYSGVPDVVETGTSGLTTAESNQLFGLPDADGTAAAVIAAAQVTPIQADVRKVNNYAVTGEGTEANPWNPA